MIILGIDPGTVITGWGVIHYSEGKIEPLDFGCIRPSRTMLLSDRYETIYDGIVQIIAKYQPETVVTEQQFVGKNVQSAIKLGMARGMALIAAKKSKCAYFEYAPTEIKLSVTGRGHASKQQVQGMIKQLLGLDQIPEPEDAADALACAICHGHRYKFSRVLVEAT